MILLIPVMAISAMIALPLAGIAKIWNPQERFGAHYEHIWLKMTQPFYGSRGPRG